MANLITYQRKIIGVERKLGFLYIPAQGQEFMPSQTAKVFVLLEGDKQASELTYNSEHKRIFGLTAWYKKQKIEAGSILDVELSSNQIKISLAKSEKIVEDEDEESEIVDISGLSSGAKGNIVEDRIKEIILLYGGGLLNVYKPVVDNRGIDLIVMKNGFFYPIFIQVKSRFNAVTKGSLLIDVSESTFSPHRSFYVIGAAFNPNSLELEDKILFIPSMEYDTISTTVNANGKRKKRFVASLKENSKAAGAKYFIHKSELVEKLMEKFEEIDKYLK